MAKFPWGDAPVTMSGICGLMIVSALGLGILLALSGPSDWETLPYPGGSKYNGVAVVTCAFFVMWYMFLGNQVGIKFTEGLSDDVTAAASTAASRTVGNTLEQAIPFLFLMWMEAYFVNARTAQLLGWIYVAFRFFYPIGWGYYGQFNLLVEVATQPNYIIIFYYLVAVLCKCGLGSDVHADIDAVSPWLMLPYLLGIGLLSFIVFLVLAKPTTMLMIAGAKKATSFVDAEDPEE